MYKFFIILYLFAGSINFVPSQNTFSRFFDLHGLNEVACQVTEVSDGYLVVGMTFENLGLWILKLNFQGDTVWMKTYSENYRARACSFFTGPFLLPDRTYAYAAITNDSTNLPQFYYIRFDSLGDTLYTRIYDSPFHQVIFSSMYSSEGDIYLWGFEAIGQNEYPCMKKIRGNGDLVWEKRFTIPGNSLGNGWSIAEIRPGKILVSSTAYPPGPAFCRLFYMDTSGTVLSAFNVLTGTAGGAMLAKPLQNGNIAISAGAQSSSVDAVFGVIDSMGTPLWSKIYKTSFDENLVTIPLPLPNNRIAFTNQTQYTHFTICNYKENGDSLWERETYYPDFLVFEINNMIRTSDGGFLTVGRARRIGYNSDDFWVQKLDSNGCMVAGCEVGIANELLTKKLNIYPNPASEKISISGDFQLPATAEFWDIVGKKQLTLEIRFHEQMLDLETLASGVYVVNIKDKNENHFSGKFLKE